MSNPTLGAGQQFVGPYDILPNIIYTNPTTLGLASQFAFPFNIDTTQETIISQNISTLSPAYQGGVQFDDNYNINTTQENIISQNISTYNPTVGNGLQFNQPYNILTNTEIGFFWQNPNPTNAANQQFTSFNPPAIHLTNTPPNTVGLTANLLIYNPTYTNAAATQFDASYDINTTQETAISQKLPGYQHPYDAPQLNPNVELTLAPDGTRIIPYRESSTPNVTSDFTNLNNAKIVSNGIGYASSIAAGAFGVGQVGQSAQKIYNTATGQSDFLNNTYFTLPFDQLTNKINLGSAIDIANSVGNLAPYPDFRAKRFASSFANQNVNLLGQIGTAVAKARKDGASATFRPGNFSPRAAAYAAASLSPAGAYSIFNLNGIGKLGYGWGDHDNEYALRGDFTLRSQVTTQWRANESGSKEWLPTKNLIEKVTPFRGDKVTVIDYGKRLLKNAYQWKPSKDQNDVTKRSLTKDFIKFFLTGPSLTANYLTEGGEADDIIVFRAMLTSLSDSFSPQWSEVKMIGRADPNYQYGGYGRSLSLGFDIVITDRDEIKPTWRKLNALAGYCAPIYDNASIALTAPWMRITLGDLFHQTPVVMNSLSYTYDLDHSWEINIEGDAEMFETPRKISVSCDFHVITDTLPQKDVRFFGLAKRYTADGISIEGHDNWLSDFKSTAPDPSFNQRGRRDRGSTDSATATIPDPVTSAFNTILNNNPS